MAATWLLQAIDPRTGQLLQDPTRGLLPPNDAQGRGAGFVSYTILPRDGLTTGTPIAAAARLLFDTLPPEDTVTLVHTLDAHAPTAETTANPLAAGTGVYHVQWRAVDDPNGSGVRHVTVYVAADGGDFEIWQRQSPGGEGQAVYHGEPGLSYEFLALATDRAGNRQRPPPGVADPDVGLEAGLARPATGDGPPSLDLGPPPVPEHQPVTNPLFVTVMENIPAAPHSPASQPGSRPAEFATVLQPFIAQAFATGIPASQAGIGPMALAEAPDGSILVSGGAARNEIYRFDRDGGTAGSAWAQLPLPIFNLAFDSRGRLWATTGGGPLLQLDPDSGAVLAEFGDGLTLALAVQPETDRIFVTSNRGVELFDPETGRFEPFSRDRHLRAGSLAVAPDGSLWATTWPDRRQIVRFNAEGRAEPLLDFDADVDSLAFGRIGTHLQGLLLVSHNTGRRNPTGTLESPASELTLVDLATRQRVAVARGGTRGDVLLATADGRLLISQSHQVDLLAVDLTPAVVATRPADGSPAVLPRNWLTVTFNRPMHAAGDSDPASVLNPGNYRLVREGIQTVPIRQVRYHAGSRTALLAVPDLTPGGYRLTVAATLAAADGIRMTNEHTVHFTAARDVTAAVEMVFANSRQDREASHVAFEVTVTNRGDYDLQRPLYLLMDPGPSYPGVPHGATLHSNDQPWWLTLSEVPAAGDVLRTGQSLPTRTITVDNPHDRRVDFAARVLAVPAPHPNPAFVTVPRTAAVAGQPYRYRAAAESPDGSPIVYLLYQGPAGMTVDPRTGWVAWDPDAKSPAEAQVVLAAFDRRGAVAEQRFSLHVAGGNRPPEIRGVEPLYALVAGERFDLLPAVTDPDGDRLITAIENMPPGATFNPLLNWFRWTPDPDAAGTYRDVTLVDPAREK